MSSRIGIAADDGLFLAEAKFEFERAIDYIGQLSGGPHTSIPAA